MTTERKLPKSLTQREFQLIADHCYHVAQKLVRKGRTVMPMCIAGTVGDHSVRVKLSVQVPTHDTSYKAMITPLMEAVVQHPDLDFVALVCEAWTAPVKNARMPEGSLANHPQREETVIFSIMSKDCQIVVMNPLRRNPSRLVRGKLDFSMKLTGRMVREPETRN
jgi:hypothetical protein